MIFTNARAFFLAALIIGWLGLVSISAPAQDITLVSGDVSFLKNETAVCVKYSYDGMLVGTNNEDVYIKQRVADWNAKEPGKGDKWLAGWIGDRARRYQPAFEKKLNTALHKILAGNPITFASTLNDARYTMILHTLVTEPGWAGWGFIHRESHIDAEVTFVETARPDKVLATIRVEDSPGNGYDYDPAGRIENCYATCGTELAHFLKKFIKL